MTSRPANQSAILFMLAAVALFALMDAGLKLLAPHYPPLQVATLRGLSSLPFVLVWVLCTANVHSLLRVHWPLHLLRGVLGIGMMVGFVYGLRSMPLSTAYSVCEYAGLEAAIDDPYDEARTFYLTYGIISLISNGLSACI